MANTASVNKRRVAVFFGGRSPEHDVSIVSGLQALEALDGRKYEGFPVYISPRGEWFVGEALRNKSNYMLNEATRARLVQVTLDITPSSGGQGRLVPLKSGLFGGAKPVTFDIALPAFHGLIGEDGGFQGLMDAANIPYAGMRTKASAVFMDKVTTKHALADTGVPQLPFAAISRPAGNSLMVDKAVLAAQLEAVGFPCCIKPAHLGSSIGVGKANNVEEARAILANLFQYDDKALAEPFVQNLTEYNVAVRNKGGRIVTSAIERPKTSAELLDFKEKYMSGNGGKGGKKAPASGTASEGMLSLTRDINPDLPADMEARIRTWAENVFRQMDGAGNPRIDFISDGKSGEVWFNELNPCPGSFAYFLWSAARQETALFSELLGDLLEEALELHARAQLPDDPTPKDAQLFPRK